MRQDNSQLDISDSPEILRLAEEVRATGQAHMLRRGDEPLAMIVPFRGSGTRKLKKRSLSEADIVAFQSAAGSWSDVDDERLLADLYAARDVPDERPSADF